ncbi:MAG: hypothetical protein ACO3QS_03585 [Burkholderiaceae bacterium]
MAKSMTLTSTMVGCSQLFRLGCGLALAAGSWLSPSAALALDFDDIAKEGELRFLAKHPEPNTYAYESHVDISAESLTTGVVGVSTCHRQLDPIRKVVIAFNPKRLIGLQVISHNGIEAVEAKGHHVTLTNVTRGANICINLTSKALDRLDDSGQTYQLHAGPLMRRYLDGYLPMQAKLNVHWTDGLLSLSDVQPTVQPGVKLDTSGRGASLDLIFAGRFTGSFLLKRP